MVHQFISRIWNFPVLAIATGTTFIPGGLILADTSSTDYIFLLDRNQQNCQQIGENYREVRAFETDSFYINICRQANNYYYLGEAKTGNIGTIFLPANVLASGEMYRADNGNVAYIVTILPSEATLTIERNGAQIARESSHKKQCVDSENVLSIDLIERLYYPMSDARILSDDSYGELTPIQGIDLKNFDNFNSLKEYHPKAILEIPNCNP